MKLLSSVASGFMPIYVNWRIMATKIRPKFVVVNAANFVISRPSSINLHNSSAKRTFSTDESPTNTREIRLLPGEPLFRAMKVGPGAEWPKSFFRQFRNFFKVWKFHAVHDRTFNFNDFRKGSQLAFLTVSKMLLNRSFDDLKALVHSSVYDRLKSATEKLSDSEREKLLQVQEPDVLMAWVLDCNYREDANNPSVKYFDVLSGFHCLIGFDKISKTIDEKISKETEFSFSKMKDYMKDVDKHFTSAALTSNLVFTKQIEPKVDDEWQLIYFNCARCVER